MKKRNIVGIGTALVAAAAVGAFSMLSEGENVAAGQSLSDAAPEIDVYKGPQCGCCDKWAEHLEAAGFKVSVKEVDNLQPIKARYGIGPQLSSCHTAVVERYAIEGHVPADDILRLLRERPAVTGLTVPGMPIGSPGMEEGPKEAYDVLTFDASGGTAVYARR